MLYNSATSVDFWLLICTDLTELQQKCITTCKCQHAVNINFCFIENIHSEDNRCIF